MIARQSIKALLLRRAAVDDFLVLISTACVIGLSIIATLLASQGLSDNSLTIEQTHFLMKGYYISNFMYIAAICSAKLSVLVIFYTIVEVQRWARRIVITVSVFVLAWSIASLLAIAIQCDIPRPWIMESNRCFNTQIFWVMYCIIDMSTEVSIVMISVNLVAYIQVPLSQKVAFITCFLPRVLVLGAALIRLIWLYPTTPQSLPEYRLWIPVIISQAQLFLSIATASIPYMVPFFKNLDVNLRTPYLATKRDRLANHRLGPSASSLWFRRSRKPKDLALWDPGAETSAQYKLAPQASPCLPTPRPLTPLSPQVIPSLPNSKSSVRGLNIYIPHRDPQRQRSIDRGSPRTESSGVLSPTCTSSQSMLLQSFIPARKAPCPPKKVQSPGSATPSSCYSSWAPTPVPVLPRAERFSLFPPQYQHYGSQQPHRTPVTSPVPPFRPVRSQTVSGVASKPNPSVNDARPAPSPDHARPPKFATTRHLYAPPLKMPSEKEIVRPGSIQDLTSPMGAAINSWFKSARGTASQPVAIDSQLYQSQPSALSPPPPYTHTFESRLRESQPEDAIVAPAEGSEQATLAPSSEVADNARSWIYCHGYRVALLKDPTRVFFICHWCFKHKLTDIGIRIYNTSAAVSSAARHLSEQKLGHRLVAPGKTLVASVYNALTTARVPISQARLLWGRDADLYNNEGVDELTDEAAFIKEWRKHGPLGVLLDIVNYIYTPQQYNLFEKAQRTAYQARLLYDCVVHDAHDEAPEDHLPINLRAALLKANEYYAKLNDSPAYYAATILHPRYKHYCDQAWAEKPDWLALNNLNFQALWADYKSLPLPRPCYTRAPKKPSNIDDAIDGIIDPTRGNTEEDEYEQWKREPIVGKGTDPIQYWFGLRDQYPNLSKMALTILSIPASSCECERVFSELGDLLEPRRRCISPELLAALHSVRRWRRAGFGGGDNDDMGQSKLTDEQMDVLYELSKWVGEDDDLDTWDDG
ncbi:Dimer-Tnp-hAT multi-domain protein [Pyrenophora tritici-repentis]|nr:Dimer-Tnp-hAT multi-domain protein [Pyrenophora tritici-repentis]